MTEQFNAVKEKAAILKASIELLLKAFRDETGYLPVIQVETKVKKTNDRDLTTQVVNVTITVG